MVTKYQPLLDMLKPQEEEPMMSQMAPEQFSSLQQAPIQAMPENYNELAQEEALDQPVVEAASATLKQTQPSAPAQDDLLKPPTQDTPMSKSEALLAEYNKMLGKDQESLAKARSQDRMLKVGGAIGDALATYLNARSQMNVKAPGVQVQQGAGLGKVADMFATAPEIQSDVAARREALMKQYAELSKGERSQARLTSEERRANERMAQQERLAKAENEAMLKAAGIRASGKASAAFTPYQEKQIKREDEKDLQKLSASVTKLGLPTITSAINSIENQLGMTLEEALQRNTDNDKTNDVEVPGYGRIGSLAPDKFVGDKSRAFRQNVGSLLNPQISKQFGASQTKGEIERFQKEVGSGTFESKAAILRGLSNIKRSANADLKATYAGYRPEIVDVYRTRKGVSLDTVKKEAVFPKTVTNKKTKETAIVEDEQELKEALAEGFE